MSSYGLMIHRCTIRRNTTTVSPSGHASAAFTDLATSVPCLEQQEKGRARLGGAGAYLEHDAIVFLPPGTDIRPRKANDLNDQLVVNDTTYLVQFVGDEAGMGDHLTAWCKRLPSGAA